MEHGAGGRGADHARPLGIGALANQQWSFAGWRDQAVSQLLIQPFVNYNLPHAWYLVSAPIITAN